MKTPDTSGRADLARLLKEKLGLSERHAELVSASGISLETAKVRGYKTVKDKAELAGLGFGPKQQIAPALLIPVYCVGPDTAPATYQIRPDAPRVNDKGQPIKYETPTGTRMVVDVPPTVREAGWLNDPFVPLYITEGVRKADAAASAGLCCVALLGVWNWCRGKDSRGNNVPLPDWDAITLRGRTVLLVFDSDVTVKPTVQKALARLSAFLEQRGADVKVVYLPAAADGAKVGLDDSLAAGLTVDELRALASDLRPPAGANGVNAGGRGPSQAVTLAGLASDAELFHTPDGEAYATLLVGGHNETWPLRSRRFKTWLSQRAFENTGMVPNTQALQDALSALEGRALFGGQEYAVFTRLAEHNGKVYLDLGDEAWQSVEIDGDGWRLVSDLPVKFRRTKGMLPLPLPVRGGKVEELRRFVNAGSEETWRLMVGWLVATFFPKGPYPLLSLHGEQGSAKSTTNRVLRALVDPNKVALRAEPREERDLMVAAKNGHVLAFDNLSHVRPWLSDALCRLSTGGGFGTRALYTDDEEALFDAQRPVILNGIEELATRSDLLDRTISVDLPTIQPDRRRPEAAFWAAFEAARPRILGALLDVVSAALRNLPGVRLERLPRMADFALLVTAAEPALGWPGGAFMDAYDSNREEANSLALETSPVPTALLKLMAKQEQWVGTAGELLDRLNRTRGVDTTQRGWPKKGHTLSGMLRRLAPNLRGAGLDVKTGQREAGTGRRLLVIRQEGGASVTERHSVTASQLSRHQVEVALLRVTPL